MPHCRASDCLLGHSAFGKHSWTNLIFQFLVMVLMRLVMEGDDLVRLCGAIVGVDYKTKVVLRFSKDA